MRRWGDRLGRDDVNPLRKKTSTMRGAHFTEQFLFVMYQFGTPAQTGNRYERIFVGWPLPK